MLVENLVTRKVIVQLVAVASEEALLLASSEYISPFIIQGKGPRPKLMPKTNVMIVTSGIQLSLKCPKLANKIFNLWPRQTF